jgi:putative cell wall-binding protein
MAWDASEYAIIASGENFPDALAATSLAKKYDAPILLTAKNSLSPVTKESLDILSTTTVYLIGGTGAISEAVEQEIEALGIAVMRISGEDRYDTSVKIAKELESVTEVVFVPGNQYAHALAVSSIAANRNMPVILMPKDSVPDSVKDYLSALEISNSFIIGSENDISSNVEKQLTNPTRISGSDIYDINLNILREFPANYTYNEVIIATSTNFADALAGTAYASQMSCPIFLLDNKSVNSQMKNHLTNYKGYMNYVNILGGKAVLPDSLIEDYFSTESLTPAEDTDDDWIFMR